MKKVYIAVMCTFDYYEFNTNLFVSDDLQKVYKFIEKSHKDSKVVLWTEEDERKELASEEIGFIEIEEWEVGK